MGCALIFVNKNFQKLFIDFKNYWYYTDLMKPIKKDFGPVPDIAEAPKKVATFVAIVFESQAEHDEVAEYLKATNQERGRGRFYARAALEKINREKKAGRWGV